MEPPDVIYISKERDGRIDNLLVLLIVAKEKHYDYLFYRGIQRLNELLSEKPNCIIEKN